MLPTGQLADGPVTSTLMGTINSTPQLLIFIVTLPLTGACFTKHICSSATRLRTLQSIIWAGILETSGHHSPIILIRLLSLLRFWSKRRLQDICRLICNKLIATLHGWHGILMKKTSLSLVKCTWRRRTVIDSPLCLSSELSHNFVLNYSHLMSRLWASSQVKKVNFSSESSSKKHFCCLWLYFRIRDHKSSLRQNSSWACLSKSFSLPCINLQPPTYTTSSDSGACNCHTGYGGSNGVFAASAVRHSVGLEHWNSHFTCLNFCILRLNGSKRNLNS